MSIERDYFKHNLYSQLGIPTTADEQTIQDTFNSMHTRAEFGGLSQQHELAQLDMIQKKINDKEYRLLSMIFRGGFGYDHLDSQITRMRSLLGKAKAISQEWIDCISSWMEILKRNEFRQYLLEKCSLTNPENGDDNQVFDGIKDSVLEYFAEIQIDHLKEAVSTAEKDNCISHYEILEGISQAYPVVKDKYLKEALAIQSVYVKAKFGKLEQAVSNVRHEESKFQAKALSSQMDRECRDYFFPFYQHFRGQDFEGKKEVMDKMEGLISEVMELIEEKGKPESLAFYQENLAEIEMPAKKGKPAKEKTKKLKKVSTDDLQGDEETQKVIGEVQRLSESGALGKARRLFYKKKNTTKNPEAQKIFRSAEKDPFFFLDKTKVEVRTKTSMGLSKRKTHENETGEYIRTVWFKMIFPLFPVRSFAFDSEDNCLGQVPLTEGYRNYRLFVLLVLFCCATAAFIFLSKADLIPVGHHEGGQPRVEEMVDEPKEGAPQLSPEEMFVGLAKYLRNNPNGATAYDSKARVKFINLLTGIFQKFYEEDKIEEFIDRFGQHLIAMNARQRNFYFDEVRPLVNKYLEKTEYGSDIIVNFSIKMSNYNEIQRLLKKKIIVSYEKKDFVKANHYLKISNQMRVSLPADVLLVLYKAGLYPLEKVLFSCEDYASIPDEYWKEGILKLWGNSNLLDHEKSTNVIRKVTDHIKDMHLDLLSILQDPNKRPYKDWENEVKREYNYPIIKKRIQVEACLSLLKKGIKEEARRIAYQISQTPRTDYIMYREVPILFLLENYRRVDFYMDTYEDKDRFSDKYKIMWGLANINIGNNDKGIRILRPVIQKFFKDYLDLWDTLNKRVASVRDFVGHKLKKREEPYRDVARKIYLIIDKEEAGKAKEEFIIQEINNDHRVKDLRKQVFERRAILDGIYGLMEGYLESNDPEQVRKAKNVLYELRKKFYNIKTELFIGKTFIALGKNKGAKEVFENLERKSYGEKNWEPLFELLKVYQVLGFDSGKKKLSKRLRKKTPQWVQDQTARTLAEIAPNLEKKLYWLKEIEEPKPKDRLVQLLFEVELLTRDYHEDLPVKLQIFARECIGNMQYVSDVNLLKKIGRTCLKGYFINSNKELLDAGILAYNRGLLTELETAEFLNGLIVFHWFKCLSRNFKVLKDFVRLTTYGNEWFYSELLKNASSGVSFFKGIEEDADLKACADYFSRLIKENDVKTSFPPLFFELLKQEDIYAVFKDLVVVLKNKAVHPVSFWKYWGISLARPKVRLKNANFQLDKETKVLKGTTKGHDQYVPNMLDWIHANLMYWRLSDDPLKMGFEGLTGKVEYCNAITTSAFSDYISLLVRSYEMAIWYDPNKEMLRDISPFVILVNAKRQGKLKSELEYSYLLERVSKLQNQLGHFFIDDLFMMLAFEGKWSKDKLKPHIKEVISAQFNQWPTDKTNMLLFNAVKSIEVES